MDYEFGNKLKDYRLLTQQQLANQMKKEYCILQRPVVRNCSKGGVWFEEAETKKCSYDIREFWGVG